MCPDSLSYEEKGLVTIEQFLGCAESAVSIFEQALFTASIVSDLSILVLYPYPTLSRDKRGLGLMSNFLVVLCQCSILDKPMNSVWASKHVQKQMK